MNLCSLVAESTSNSSLNFYEGKMIISNNKYKEKVEICLWHHKRVESFCDEVSSEWWWLWWWEEKKLCTHDTYTRILFNVWIRCCRGHFCNFLLCLLSLLKASRNPSLTLRNLRHQYSVKENNQLLPLCAFC